MFAQIVQETPIPASAQVRQRTDRAVTSVPANRKTIRRFTDISSPVVRALRTNALGTATQAELEASHEDPEFREEDSSADEFTRTLDNRMELLARRFEGDASIEDLARIHLLTVRLRRLDPRVTRAEQQATEEIVQSMERVDANLAAIRAQFGI